MAGPRRFLPPYRPRNSGSSWRPRPATAATRASTPGSHPTSRSIRTCSRTLAKARLVPDPSACACRWSAAAIPVRGGGGDAGARPARRAEPGPV